MNTQTLTNSANLCNFSIALPTTDIPRTQPIRASSREYGFDFDEDELARELLAPLPNSADQATISLDAEELCALCFLS